MSFKQAKELVERMEFSELALKKAVDNLEKSTKNFDFTLKKQEEILGKLPAEQKKSNYLFIAIAINIGFFLGLFVGKFFL